MDTTRTSNIKAEEIFPISEQGYTIGKLLDWMEHSVKYDWIQEQGNHSCPNHIINDANLYIHYQSLLLKMQGIQVGTGKFVSVISSYQL